MSRDGHSTLSIRYLANGSDSTPYAQSERRKSTCLEAIRNPWLGIPGGVQLVSNNSTLGSHAKREERQNAIKQEI